MSQKTFKVPGIATDSKGNTKVRYANDLQKRVVVLFTNKFTNINFVELPQQMSKLDACNYILELDNFKNDKSVIESEIRKMNKKIKVTADDILKAISMRDRVLA
jgi:hypothetical protein